MWTDETLKPLPDTLATNLELEDIITPLTEALKPLLDTLVTPIHMCMTRTRLTDTVEVVMLLMDMDILVTLLLEDLAREVEEEVLDVLTRPALSSSSMSGRTASTTTSCSMIRSPCRANTASREAMAAIDGGRRHGGT